MSGELENRAAYRWSTGAAATVCNVWGALAGSEVTDGLLGLVSIDAAAKEGMRGAAGGAHVCHADLRSA